jgi:hypothetical protein
MGELKKNIRRETTDIPAEDLQRQIRSSPAGDRNVYVWRDSIFNICSDLWIVTTYVEPWVDRDSTVQGEYLFE